MRGTKKLRDRLKKAPAAGPDDQSTTELGDWFATALFLRPQVALLVNQRTFVPVLVELAPASTLLDRVPAAIEMVLRHHGLEQEFLSAERGAMREVRLAPTNDRRVLGVMNELTFQAEIRQQEGVTDLVELSLDLAGVILGPLHNLGSSPDRALAAVVGTTTPLADVSPLRPDVAVPEPRPLEPTSLEVGGVFHLKVTLRDTKPAVWRRVLVDGSSTLDHLHEVIQAAFGWWDYHLHDFEIDGTNYGVPDADDDDWGVPTIDETGARLDSIAGPGSRFLYRYDFGDNWRHDVVVEKVLPADGSMVVPACVDGRRACPPEDCGGTGGFRDLLAILAYPRHPEHRERREWMGRDYDPASFDPSEFEDNLRSAKLAAFDDERS
ncbi:hypothetical protein BH24ACT4_BH24ACT4_20930 [soil metagenome]